jgi:hypothetical protein
MEQTPDEIARPSITSDIEPGWMSSELEQSRARRMAFDAGVKMGAARLLSSPILEALMTEISLLRKITHSLIAAAELELAKRDRMIARVNDERANWSRRSIQLARELDRLTPGWNLPWPK